MRALGIILGCLVGLGGQANAHGQCMPFMAWLDTLQRSHGEMLLDGGMNKLPVAHLENEKTGTWSLLRLSPNGMACLVAHGTKVIAAADPPA